MKHYALVCPPLPAHHAGMNALGHELLRRGHRVTAIGFQDAKVMVASEMAFASIAANDRHFRVAAFHARMASLSGVRAMIYALSAAQYENRVFLEEGPALFKRLGVDAVLADVGEPAMGSIADVLKIPYVTIFNGPPVNREPAMPPCVTPWLYDTGRWAQLRNTLGYATIDSAVYPMMRQIARRRREWSLPRYRHPDDFLSQRAQLCQLVPELDFPRVEKPACLYFTGPFTEVHPAPPPPQRQVLTQVVGLLGTDDCAVRARECVAAACAGLGVSFLEAPELTPGPAELAQVSVAVTNVNVQSIMAPLTQGVPLLAIPVSNNNDQAGMGARIRWSGVGELLEWSSLSVSAVRRQLQRLLKEPRFRERAGQVQSSVALAGGLSRAVDIIEEKTKERAA